MPRLRKFASHAPNLRKQHECTDVHIVGRNASNTKPAKFLKEKGAPVLVPES